MIIPANVLVLESNFEGHLAYKGGLNEQVCGGKKEVKKC